MKKRLLVISADAMVNEDLEYMSTLPNFRKYLQGGVRAKSVKSIYPTFTYPAHASILTGCFPKDTGIVNNVVFSLDPHCNIWEWDSRRIKVSDIFAAAKKGGYSTAAVLWPVTGNNPNIDYLVNEYWMPNPWDTLESSFRESGSSEETIEIIKNNERYLPGTYWRTGQDNFAIHPIFDRFGIGCACDIIRKFKPEVFFIHTSPIDNIRHAHGTFCGEYLKREIRRIDEQLGLVCEALEDAGVLEETNIVLLSDHGQLDCHRIVNLNVVFEREGLLSVNENGVLNDDWKAYCLSVGMSAYVYLSDSADKELYARVRALLDKMSTEGLFGFKQVMTSEETREKWGLDGDFSFVLETDGVSGFGNNCTGELVKSDWQHSDYRYNHGKHGYQPEKGPQPVFAAKGPDFAENSVVDTFRLVDEAPTFAYMLGVNMPQAEGKPVLELLR